MFKCNTSPFLFVSLCFLFLLDRKGKQSILGPDQSSLQCVHLLVFFIVPHALYVDYGVLWDFSNLLFRQCIVHCSLCTVSYRLHVLTYMTYHRLLKIIFP